jgi:hypothetical protein
VKESKIKFVYKLGDGVGEFPEDLELSVEFDGDSTASQVVEAFKMFLLGAGYHPKVVEAIEYEAR